MKTTISVEGELRDRLAMLAAHHGRTLGEQVAAMVEAEEEREFWDGVSTGYNDPRHAGLDVELHDDYPEYADVIRRTIPAEGSHNQDAHQQRQADSTRRRRAAA